MFFIGVEFQAGLCKIVRLISAHHKLDGSKEKYTEYISNEQNWFLFRPAHKHYTPIN